MGKTRADDHTTPVRAEQAEAGDALRTAVPRGAHGDWQPAAGRPDPVALLTAQDEFRSADLVPIRHGRMATSALRVSG